MVTSSGSAQDSRNRMGKLTVGKQHENCVCCLRRKPVGSLGICNAFDLSRCQLDDRVTSGAWAAFLVAQI